MSALEGATRDEREGSGNGDAEDSIAAEFLLDNGGASPHSDPAGSIPHHPRSLTFVNGLAIMMSLQIGAGIFSSPAAVRTSVESSAAAVIAWLAAGLLMWSGSAAFVELGIRIPSNGGMQEYLRYYYGELYGFIFSSTWILLSRPTAMAMVSLVFSEYMFRTLFPGHDISPWVLKAVSVLSIASVTLFNLLGTSTGATAANIFLALKMLGIGSVAIAGFSLAVGGILHPEKSSRPNAGVGIAENLSLWPGLGGFSDAILACLFAYGGSESLGFVIGEIKEPARTVPRIVHAAMATVVVLFVLANIAFYQTLSREVLSETNAVAIVYGRAVAGELGAWAYAAVVCICSLGSLNAIIFSAARLTQAASSRRYLPTFIGKSSSGTPSTTSAFTCSLRRAPSDHSTARTSQDENLPRNAMVLNAIIAFFYTLTGSFRQLLTLKSLAELTMFVAAASCVIVSRYGRGNGREAAPAHYQTSTANPLIFCLAGSAIVIRGAIAHPLQALIIAGLCVTGALVFRLVVSKNG